MVPLVFQKMKNTFLINILLTCLYLIIEILLLNNFTISIYSSA